VKDLDSVEINKEVSKGACFVTSLEDDAISVDPVELHEALSRRQVYEPGLLEGLH